MSTSSTSTAAVVTSGRPPLRATARSGALLTVLALLCSLLVTVAATPAEAGTYRADGEVTYKEYWVPHSEFTGGCGAQEVPQGGTRSIEPWGCEKTLELTIPDDFSQSARAEIYIDLWRNHTTQAARFRVNDGAVRQPDVGADWSRTPYVGDLPLSELRQGANTLTFWSGSSGYHVYDVAVRIYHDDDHPLVAGPDGDTTPPTGRLERITADNGDFDPAKSGILKVDSDTLALSASASGAQRVEFHARYEGYDEDNDGVTADWHSRSRNNWSSGGVSAKPSGGTIDHVGTVTTAPFTTSWRIPHVVNQAGVRFKVRLVDAVGNVRESAGGLSAPFTLSRADATTAHVIPGFADAVLHHGGTRGDKARRSIDLPSDLSDVRSAHLVGSFYQNPSVSLNGNAKFRAFAAGEDPWTLSVRQVDPAHLVGGTNQIIYSHHPDVAWGEFVEKPGPMVVLRRPDRGPARLVSEPRDVTVSVGEPAEFSVEGTGAWPLTYQWQRDGVDIPGANGSSFTLQSPASADHGARFRVRVTNALGEVTSRAATLITQDPSGIDSDDFSGQTLDPQVWTFVDPLGDSSATLADHELTLSVPGGASHDLWAGANHAPRILQTVADMDFEVEAKFTSAVTEKFQDRGFVVQQGSGRFLRVGVYHDGSSVKLFAAAVNGSTSNVKLRKGIAGGAPLWLRLQRSGASWTVRHSFDGTSWTEAGTFSDALVMDAIGVYALNVGSPAPAHTAVVDHFYNVAAPGPGDPEPDTAAPVISAPDVAVTGSSAVVSWSTDEPSSSAVSYGPTTAYGGGTVESQGMVTEHTLELTDLACGTVYHYRIDSADAAGNVARTPDATFQSEDCPPPDTTAPVISGVQVEPDAAKATVRWTTDEAASSSVAYGLTTAHELGTVQNAELVTEHEVVISGLQPETVHHLAISSVDATGNTATTSDDTFTTTAMPPPFASDDFDAPGLDASRWSVVDPVGDGSVEVSGAGTGDARLRMSVPAGVSHDLWNDNRALRVVQPARDVDFTADVKFDSTPSAQFQMQGLLVEQDADNWLRFEFYRGAGELRAFAASTLDGASTAKLNAAVPSGTSSYVRVTRSGDVWTMATSTDGRTWVDQGSFPRPLAVTAVGPFVANHASPASASPAFTAVVDYVFDAAAPVDPEDGVAPVPEHSLAVDTAGEGAVALSPAQETYAEGQEVALTATPAAGWRFSGWSGDLTGSSNPAAIVMDTDKVVTATFVSEVDDAPPVISGVQVETGPSTATVHWTTDEPASSSVAYGPTAAHELGSVDDPALVTDHEIVLSALEAETVHHFAISSTDASGNTSTSPDATFTTAAAPTSSSPVSDDFDAVALDESLWSVVDPVGDGTVELVGAGTGDARLRLSVPGGVSHDVWNANDSLRVVQAVADGDFSTDVKFHSVPTAKYQMQGLLVEQDPDNWLRFELHHDGTQLKSFAASTVGGRSTVQASVTESPAPALYLRVSRTGDRWTMLTSADGTTWAERAAFDRPLTVSAVGPFVANHHSKTSNIPAFTAEIDYVFDTAAPILAEDGNAAEPQHTLVVGTEGAGTVQASPEQASYAEGEQVTLTATPADDAAFSHWSGDLTGSTNPVTVVMDDDKVITATFGTRGEPAEDDTTPPLMDDLAIDAGSSSATVRWTTDEPATSSVAYGPTTAYELGSVDDAELVTDHEVVLSGLEPESLYHFAVSSVDAAGNTATAPDDTLMTTPLPPPDDVTAPVIGAVEVEPGASQATVRWTTDEPASSSVAYGPSSAYELGSVDEAALVTDHEVVLSGLDPESAYHFMISSADSAGNTAVTPDASFTTTSASALAIDVWYGSRQVFGHHGKSQQWVNVLGAVSPVESVTALSYRLNGGPERALNVGPDARRLAEPGDFNVELDYAELVPGDNEVVIIARGGGDVTVTETVTVVHQASPVPSLPHVADWQASSNILDAAQVVDGRWSVTPEGVRVDVPHYDRVLALGDVAWQDYEVTAPVTVHGLGSHWGTPESGAPLVGLGLRWQGHSAVDDEQPRHGWYPVGAYSWYSWNRGRFELLGNEGQPLVRESFSGFEFGTTYVFKVRVETVVDGTAYSFKYWEQDAPEPADWDLSIVEPAGNAQGAVGLIAHHVHAVFGDVEVAPLGGATSQ